VTEGDWEPHYNELLKKLSPKILFDALGGGEVQAKLIKNLPGDATVLVYGLLEEKPTSVLATNLLSGLTVGGFMVTKWYHTLKPEEK